MPASREVRSQTRAIEVYNKAVLAGDREAADEALTELIDATLVWGSGNMSDSDFHWEDYA